MHEWRRRDSNAYWRQRRDANVRVEVRTLGSVPSLYVRKQVRHYLYGLLSTSHSTRFMQYWQTTASAAGTAVMVTES